MRKQTLVPAEHGPYAQGQERVARTVIDGNHVEIIDLRDNDYPGNKVIDVRWVNRRFDVRELTNVWVYVTYFAKFKGVAHTELGFEFADGQTVIASFEVRLLEGQSYSVGAGFKKTYPITLRWGTEFDIVYRRIAFESFASTHMLEADITQSLMTELFLAAANRTNELHEQPEWYHTVSNSCTTKLVDLVDEVLPGHIRWTPRVVLPGHLPKFWAKQGVLKMHGSFDETMAAAAINERAAEVGNVADFSARLHGRT